MLIQDHGIRQLKDLDHRRDMVIVYMQVDQPQHLECVNICKAGTSGAARTPVLLSCIAGAGSGPGAGTAPPAIKWPSGGVNSPKGKRGSPLHI